MSSVSVLCRLKPADEDDVNDFIVIDEENENTLVVDNNKKEKGAESLLFAFDHIVPSEASQDDVFEIVKPVVHDALLGYNSTIFTYGQTGSGKTFTMHGGSSDSKDARGVVPRAMEVVFEKMNAEVEAGTGRIELMISCLEIYQEKLFDLLQDDDKSRGPAINNSNLRIRQRQNGEVWVEGLTDKTVTDMDMFEDLFALAIKRRSIGSHSMNSESSRSHFCCIVSIEKHTIPASEKITSKIHLIDLAGSEMVRKTSAGGARLNEAKFINKSLSALGNVINALTLGSGGGPGASTSHIPYRDSKLTRLLQDSLSGNAKTLLILTLSLSSCHLQESIATLRFGERARKLKTVPKINTELTDASLKKALLRAEKQLVVLNATIAELREEVKKKDKTIESLRLNGNKDHENCNHCRLLKEENDKLIAALKNDAKSNASLSGSKAKTPKNKSKSKHKASPKMKREVDKMTPEEIQNRFDVSRVVTVDGSDTTLKAEEESRCGVCRLNESETALLLQDTGEELGSYFTCDGNCGNRFHVKCAGEVAEDGTYTVPSGEWYCTSCAVDDDDSVTKAPTTISPSKMPISVDDDNEEELNTPSLQNKGMKVPSGIDNEAQIQQTMARLQAEYHAMRRERNRVLNQWQHEKRLQAVSEKYREESERDRDEELITAKEVILKLQSDVLKAQKENNRLKTINDDILLNVEKQKESEVIPPTPTETETDGDIDEIKKKKEGKEKRKSNVDSELRKKITSDIMNSKPSSREKEPVGVKRPESVVRTSPIGVTPTPAITTVEAKTSKFQIKSMPKLVRKSKKTGQILSAESPLTPSVSDENFASPIPKPWVQRTQSESDTVISRKLSTSPIRSRKEHSNSAGATLDNGTEGSGRRNRSRPQQSSPVANTSDEVTDTFDSHSELSSSLKSPLFNSRLKSLLASVQEEAGQYQEIRKKHKVRSDERELLKSRSGGRGNAPPLPSIAHIQS